MPIARPLTSLLLVSALVAGCRAESLTGPEVRMIPPAAGAKGAIEVSGLDAADAQRLRATTLTRDEWNAVLRVSVGDGQPAVLGDYAVESGALRFTPLFPFDLGRQYQVTFVAAAIPGGAVDDPRRFSGIVSLPAPEIEPSTVVSRVFPSSDVVPENQLRLYIHFSAPMGRRGGLEFIRLLDEKGEAVEDPFLPLDAEFWNGDFTRYTVFFDPGRQKRGILPNQEMGRSLEPGKQYTLVVDREWRDANGQALKDEFRRTFRVEAADERPLDVKAWRITPPAADTRDAVVVTFPESLDHGLLLRALGVTDASGTFLQGEIAVDAAETRWRFTPKQAWQATTYQVTALPVLEDLAGNRIGRAFEVDEFSRVDSDREGERTNVPFRVGPAATTRQ
jgi:hypothetical protein